MLRYIINIFLVFQSISCNSTLIHSRIPVPYRIRDTAFDLMASIVLLAFNLDFKILRIRRRYSFCIMVFISWFFTLLLSSTPKYVYSSPSSSDLIFSLFHNFIPSDDTIFPFFICVIARLLIANSIPIYLY